MAKHAGLFAGVDGIETSRLAIPLWTAFGELWQKMMLPRLKRDLILDIRAYEKKSVRISSGCIKS